MASLFDDHEAERRYMEYKSKDPFPDIPPALLNSADIENYVNATGMLCPFDPEKLKSASYEAGFEGEIYCWDKEENEENKVFAPIVFIEKDKKFILKKNSIAFIYLRTKFRLPDYLALRFNLKITHVHRGILLGTGPLVDPGFAGRLLIPLHNLTSNDYEFICGEGLIWIEFTKISTNKRWTNDVSELSRSGHYKEFPDNKRNLTPGNYFEKAAPGRSIRSSIPEVMIQAKNEAKKAAESAANSEKTAEKTKRNITYGGIIGFLFFFIPFFSSLYFGYVQISQLVEETTVYVKDTSKDLKDEQLRIKLLENEIQSLKKEIQYLKEIQKNQPKPSTNKAVKP